MNQHDPSIPASATGSPNAGQAARKAWTPPRLTRIRAGEAENAPSGSREDSIFGRGS